MDTEEYSPPLPEAPKHEAKATTMNDDEEEDEGEQFDFDSGDDIPEADRQVPVPSPHGPGSNIEPQEATEADNLENPTKLQTSDRAAGGAPVKVNPYSVVDISPVQDKEASSSPESSPQDERASPNLSSGYSAPVPCGYAVPCNLPLIPPAYSTSVIIRSVSLEEAGMQSATEECHFNSANSEEPQESEENQAKGEDDAPAKSAPDHENPVYVENLDEVIYDDVPREDSDSEAEKVIYDDVENDDGSSSLEYGWSSSEFESYEEQGDSECKTGIPTSFVPSNNKAVCIPQCYSVVGVILLANTCLSHMYFPCGKFIHEVQKLVRAAKEGTKDGFEKTKAAVKRGRSFIRTKSFISQGHRSSYLEEEELNLFIDVDSTYTEAIISPMPKGLSQQQIVRRDILAFVVDNEKNYVDALKRILEQYEKPLSEMEPKLLSERKLKTVFYRIKKILQCHSMFQIALASRVSEWDRVEMIGDVFVASFSKSMVLDAYSEYVNNFSTAVGILKKTCATKPAFLDFLKKRQESSPDRITLYGLMMKPIQRFPQFILLLQASDGHRDMLMNTDKGHPDRLPLQMALTELETLAEKLNERKRDADQHREVKQIAKAMNEHYLNKLLSSGNRYLVRIDDMVELVYNNKGEILKTKERRLFMLNDVLMCATVNGRNSCGNSGTVKTKQRYLLKWSVPLGQVEVIEYGGSEGQGDNYRFSPDHSAENTAVNSKTKELCMGPGQLYHDLQSLLHDLNVVGQITQLIGSLKGNYQNLNQSVAQDWTSGLQKLISKKEDEIRVADRCRIQLQLPGKQDKSRRATFFTALFHTFTPAIKQSWKNDLQMAKLALEPGMLFYCGNCSLFLSLKIECAAYNPESYLSDEAGMDSCATEHGYLWIGSCSNQMGQIAIVSFQNANPMVIECFNVESRILCMVYVPEEKPTEQSKAVDSENSLANASNVPTICLGMEEGSISIYRCCQDAKKIRLQHFFTPEKSTVMSLTYMPQCLIAGLVNGTISIYTKAEDGTWKTEPQKTIKLGVLPVRSLLVMEKTVWAACGGQVSIINAETRSVETHFEAHQGEGMVISHMAVVGVGIWIAFTFGSTIRLFHTETLEHLQDVNIAAPVHNMMPGQHRVCVTSLLVCHGLLLVGTNRGMIVAFPVPRLQGIPKVTGRGMVSYHAHSGPVKFLVTATSIIKNRNKLGNSRPCDPEPKDDDQKNVLHNERPGSSLSHTRDTAVWLGGSVGSAAQKSDLVSYSESLISSRVSGSLEHRPEDSNIYDLVKAQNLSIKSKRQRSKKMTANSVLVVSGGQGHKRLSKKTKVQREDELVSSVMIWQIPLLNI
ncbi:ARHGA factor, partial [Upupa epops]|nr:ARHGA factor [Upupa epops]